jgi:peroxiredoxin
MTILPIRETMYNDHHSDEFNTVHSRQGLSMSDEQQQTQPAQPATNPPEKHLETEGGRPSPVLIVLLVMPLTGILVALLMIATNMDAIQPNTSSGVRTGNSLIGNPAPDFQLRNLDGQPVSLSDYEGRTLFLNFWQTTCIPCIDELPEFADFQADYSDTAAVLAVNFDETTGQVTEFLAEYGISGVPIAMDPNSDARSTYAVAQIPVTFIINPDGIVRFMRVGAMTLGDMEDYLELVQTTSASTDS